MNPSWGTGASIRQCYDIIKNRQLATRCTNLGERSAAGYLGKFYLCESFRVRKLKLMHGFSSILYNGRIVTRNRILDYLSIIYDSLIAVHMIYITLVRVMR